VAEATADETTEVAAETAEETALEAEATAEETGAAEEEEEAAAAPGVGTEMVVFWGVKSMNEGPARTNLSSRVVHRDNAT